MENVDVLFAIANMDDRIYVVGRSRLKAVNVGEILHAFGGGGHATAASATIRSMTLSQVEVQLIKHLQKTIVPVTSAKDFMTTPVKTIDAQETLEKASTMLTRYNINVLPVIEEDKLVGLISRQIIEKAKFHGLKGARVREYMISEFSSAALHTPLSIIKQHIIEENQRFLPVLDGKNIAGAITRTDLLRILHLPQSHEHIESDSRPLIAKKITMKSLLAERLPSHIVALLPDIGQVAESLGYQAYAIGGFVRDIFLRVPDYDIDVVIEGDGIHFARIFAASKGYAIKMYKKFGTAVIDIGEGRKIDIASSRLEYYEKPAALPKVEMSSIKLDLYRRDFTINTLAIKLNPLFFSELIDFFGARKDIKEKTIRVLHNLSFIEDPSRIFRAVRFEQRFDFHISKLTKNLIENAVKLDIIANLSGKRLYSEIVSLLGEEKAVFIIRRLDELNLLKYIHKDIQYDNAMKTLFESICAVTSWYDLLYLDNTCEKWFVLFLGLLERIKIHDIDALCRDFDIKRKYADYIRLAKTKGHEVLYNWSRKRTVVRSEIYRSLHCMPVEVCLYLMAKTGRQSTKKAFSLYFTKLSNVKVHINGDDLICLGIPPGKVYKNIFDNLLDAVLNEKIFGKEEEIHYIKLKYSKMIK